MSAFDASIVLRRRTLLESMDLSVRFIARFFRKYLAVSALVLAPWLALIIWFREEIWWCILFAFLGSFFAELPFLVLSSRLLFETDVKVRSVIWRSFVLLPKYVFMRALWGVLIVIAIFPILVTMLLPIIVGQFLPEVLVLEGHSNVFRAFPRGIRVSTINMGVTVGSFFLLLFLRVAFALVLMMASLMFLSEFLQIALRKGLFAHALDWDLLCVGWLVFSVFHATSRFLVYINIRGETEAWDVQARFLSITKWIDSKGSEVAR